jgi:hypothetical protein
MARVTPSGVEPAKQVALAAEGPLRVAAATLAHAAASEITATTSVGIMGTDDRDEIQRLAAEIADEFDLDITLRLSLGSYSVRFSRPKRGTGP